MSRSNDPGHYFQTSDALATSKRKAAKAKNQHGDPIQLPSKILAAVPAGATNNNNQIYVAEAAGEIHLVDLSSKQTENVFSQGSAPLTCLAVGADGTVYAGSWDKNVYAIDPTGNKTKTKTKAKTLRGHTDFVKCLLITKISGREILLSGGADATIIVWDLSSSSSSSTSGDYKILHKLKVHTQKALQALAIDASATTEDSITLFSASSDREIRRWEISLSTTREIHTDDALLRPHETSIYRLRWSSENGDGDDGEDGDLWTASADKTAKRLLRHAHFATSDTTLEHPDFVRDVLPFDALGLVVTACRDEEVRVWEIASGQVLCTYSGHYEEVTGLLPTDEGKGVVSVSIDGTVRKWSLLREEMAQYQERLAREANGEEGIEGAKTEENMLTAEEEAELAELMEDDD
ncbi:WD repeat-containing [Lecanosticta acicola]|uniref:WD repeat-containing n=1 Tax=Lecanosticta acicola TaxID=111012 RepID=A0AAI8Z940_9PEZI|nr:WD repeat-containing [Lecanosticta acicola]